MSYSQTGHGSCGPVSSPFEEARVCCGPRALALHEPDHHFGCGGCDDGGFESGDGHWAWRRDEGSEDELGPHGVEMRRAVVVAVAVLADTLTGAGPFDADADQ